MFQEVSVFDLNTCGSGILPSPSELKLKTTLGGPFILQVSIFIQFPAIYCFIFCIICGN